MMGGVLAQVAGTAFPSFRCIIVRRNFTTGSRICRVRTPAPSMLGVSTSSFGAPTAVDAENPAPAPAAFFGCGVVVPAMGMGFALAFSELGGQRELLTVGCRAIAVMRAGFT